MSRRSGSAARLTLAPHDETLRAEIVDAFRRMHSLRLVSGTVGNVSLRSRDSLLITPTRVHACELTPAEVVRVELASAAHEPWARPSRELPLHLAVYRERADVAAVVHTHSPFATAWSFLGEPLVPRLEDLDYHGVGEVRTTPPSPSGSHELAVGAVSALRDAQAVLLGGHGVVTVGRSLRDALCIAEIVEHQAHVCWVLRGDAAQLSGLPPRRPGELR